MCFPINKTHACKRNSFLVDCTILQGVRSVSVINVTHGNNRITHEKLHQEILAWRAVWRTNEKSIFPLSIYEDCSKSWLAVRAKALCNFEIFPTCMIIKIVGFLAEAFP